MNKNELKIGEIYKVKLKNSMSLTYVMKATKDLKNVKNIPSYNSFMKEGDFNNDNNIFEIATPEEKHWLNTCIKQDKFITFEEAMKTFIPEYVECINWNGYSHKTGVIYKINEGYIDCEKKTTKQTPTPTPTKYTNNTFIFKPSTKEAYDAQFVVKEPEFVLPEKWCIKQNISKEICDWFNKNGTIAARTTGAYTYLNYPGINGYFCDQIKPGFTEITFEQFKKYVLKETEELSPLKLAAIEHPRLAKIESKPFEILSIVNNITKEKLDLNKDGYFRSKYSSIHLNNINDKYSIVSVVNKEGNIFEIGDTIISIKSKRKTVQTIKSFQYSADKLKIQAVTTLHVKGINIERLEHFIEVEPEFVLPDTWYVVVNKENLDTLSKWMFKNSNFKLAIGGIVGKNNFQGCKNSKGWNETKIIKGKYYDFGNEITFEQFKKYVLKETKIVEPVVKETQGNGTIYYKGKRAEIIGYEPQVGDDFIITYHGNGEITNNTKGNKVHKIINFKGSYENLNSVITFQREHYKDTVLLRNIKIIK